MRFYIIFIVLIILSLNILNSQTVNEIKEMQELYDQYKKGQIPDFTPSLEIDKIDKAIDGAPIEYDLLISKPSIDNSLMNII